jgi:hypothetical protein
MSWLSRSGLVKGRIRVPFPSARRDNTSLLSMKSCRPRRWLAAQGGTGVRLVLARQMARRRDGGAAGNPGSFVNGVCPGSG